MVSTSMTGVRRMNGRIQLWRDGTVPGPYKKEAREHWLSRVLEAQQSVRRHGPEVRHEQIAQWC